MKMKILLSALFFSFSLSANELCQKTWEQSDKLEGMIKHLESFCEITSEDKKFGLQAILYKKECRRFEGGKPGDCIYVRECTGTLESSTISPPIYDTPEFVASLCRPEDDRFVLLDADSGAAPGSEAYIECHKGTPQHLVLKYRGETKKCAFSPKR